MSEPIKYEEYGCEVVEVFSGDDLVVMVDIGFDNLWKRQRVRLYGVDTPNAVNATEDTLAGKIRKQVKVLARHKRGMLRIMTRSPNSWVVVLTVEAGPEHGGALNLNEHLIQQGYVFKRAEK